MTLAKAVCVIPILDFQRFRSGDKAAFVAEIGRACREIGFVILRGHGIERGRVNGVFKAAHAFFALDAAEKEEFLRLLAEGGRPRATVASAPGRGLGG